MALLRCAECGHEISDQAPACPHCGRSLTRRSGVLASNVSSVEMQEAARKRRTPPYPFILGGLLLVVSGAFAALLLLSATQERNPPAARGTPTALPAAAARTASSSSILPEINGVSCDALESTIEHIHVHLAVFVSGEEQQIPFGIGIGQPWQVTDTDQGPFVEDGTCFYWIHTHTEDGVVHIESPVRRRFTLGDFFAIWGVPLSDSQVGFAQGQVTSYVNGQSNTTLSLPAIPLLPHARIQLNVGGDVPPEPFDFPPND